MKRIVKCYRDYRDCKDLAMRDYSLIV